MRWERRDAEAHSQAEEERVGMETGSQTNSFVTLPACAPLGKASSAPE